MAQNKVFKFGPIALTNTLTTNILNPGTTTGGVNATAAPYDKTVIILKKIRVVNKTGGTVTLTLYVGATGANAAGTEFMGTATAVAANSFIEWTSPGFPLYTSDFLVGGASAGTSLTIEGEGEIGVA